MKKIVSFLTLILTAICVNAQEENVYLQDCTVQAGAKAVIKVIVTHDTSKGCIGSMQFNYSFDDGIVVRDNGQDVVGVGATTVNDKTNFVLLGGMESTTKAAPEGACVCVFNIDIPADMTLGAHTMSISNVQAVYEDGITDFNLNYVESTMTVQKAAVIEPQDEDFSFDILPAQISSATTYLPILMKNKLDVANYTLEVTYPAGITPKSGRGVAPKVNTSNLYSTTDPSIAALSVSQTISGQVAKYTISNAETDTYMAKDEYYEVLQVPVTVSSTDAICNIKVKVSDIVAYDADNDVNLETPINVKGGEFMTTLIIGQPKAEEAILYGNYNEATASAFTTALKNVAIADVTAATVDDGAKFTDVLVNEKGGNSYYTRNSANYGTTVLPLDLTTENVDELYMIESMDAKSIVLKKAENVTANTPCIFKGTINVEGATPTLGVPSEQGLGQTTFKGTYEATEIADGAGYYISSNGKFYGDGATIRPFRGYFDGAIAGVKSFSVMLDTEDGLIDITNQFSEEDIYSLQGMKLNKAQKGVNIINGKKVLKK